MAGHPARKTATGKGKQAADPLHKAALTFRQHGVTVDLEVLEGVFAGAGVDAGTRHLLRWLAGEQFAAPRTVLDVGCGYGPLALWLAAARPDRTVLAVDRDARAVEATSLGAASNGLDDRVEVVGSLGYDGVGERRFDLIVSNIPAKVGPAALAHLVLDARYHLTDGGQVAVVVVDRVAAAVHELLGDPAVEIVVTHPTKAYTAFVYRFDGDPVASSPRPGFERGLYRRGHQRFTAARIGWEADVSWSISEFDTLGHGTLAALEVLQRVDAPILIHGVGQGHLALGLRAAGNQGAIRLADRDMLALRTAAANLDEGNELHHEGRFPAELLAGARCAVLALPEREPVAVTAAVLGPALAGCDGDVVLHGRTADVTRVLELLPRSGARLEVSRRVRQRSHTAVLGTPAPVSPRGRR